MTADLTLRKIALFGNFGSGNLGNEATLKAMIHNLKRHMPNAEITCICPWPEETALTHEIAAYPMRDMFPVPCPKKNKVVRWLRRIFIRIPLEPYRWFNAIRILRGNDMLIITGTGMTTGTRLVANDFGFDILCWSIFAKLCRCKLLFVSVGVDPLRRRVTRHFVTAALALADYRSYRDNFSQEHLKRIGFDTDGDRIYPDLAFSLPRAVLPCHEERGSQRGLIGVGLITHYNQRATSEDVEKVYREYIAKVARFVTWLLQQKYAVRLLIGDVVYDTRVRQDLRELLERSGFKYEDGKIIDEPAASVEHLLSQLAETDVVVASRFHNVLLALLLSKPVVAISFHEKVDSLMTTMGLSDFCQDIAHVDVDKLIDQFTAVQKNAGNLKGQIERKTEAYRRALDGQYDLIFKRL